MADHVGWAHTAEVQRAAWEGRIPASVSLARDELTTIEQPLELYVRAAHGAATWRPNARDCAVLAH
jgi:hypothetical protein